MEGVFKHYKGGLYRIIMRDVIDCDVGTPHVVYVSLANGAVYVRDQAEFDGMIADKYQCEIRRFQPV